MAFEEEWTKFLAEQKRKAGGLRLEQLNKDKSGERKMMEVVVWPVFKSFEGWILEHEIVSSTGVRIFVDAFFEPLVFALESEGFVAHAENITRDRFDFERMRIRTLAAYKYKFIPFSWDQLDKKPEACRRSMYELLGSYSAYSGNAYSDLSVYEREIVRYALRLCRPLRLLDVRCCLHASEDFCRGVLRNLMEKKLIQPYGNTRQRHHSYVLEPAARELFL